jgi:hypothetical protein
MRWARHVACVEEIRSAYSVMVEKPEGKKSLGRHRCAWEYNIKMDLQEIGLEAWTGLI